MEKPVPFQCQHRSRGVLVLWLLFILIALAWPARADLQFDVFVGYGMGANDGAVAEASWVPVTCEIFNDGPGFEGVVEISSSQSGQRYSAPLELPTGTRKRLLVPVYASGRWLNLEARLRDSRGKVRAAHNQLQARACTDRHSPLIGSLARTLAGSVSLPEPPPDKENNQLRPAVTRLSVELFPDHPLALEGLSVLYLHPTRALELKSSQVTAVLAWLHNGGRLIVAAEQPGDINAVPWLRQILPCEITSSTMRAEHRALQSWLNSDPRRPISGQMPNTTVTTRSTRRPPKASPVPAPEPPPEVPAPTGKPAEANPFVRLDVDLEFEAASLPVAVATVRDGQVILGSEQNPLAVRGVRGRGSLTVLLFNPELEPFKSWKNKTWFWAKLADVPIEWLGGWKFARLSGQSLDSVFGAMIDSRQIRKLPVGWLFVLLLAYLAVIGPFDQYVLKKLNRQMLTWITFPAYVAFFSVLIYYIGYRLRAGETEWNELHVVDVIPHGARADLRGHSYGSVYSPANAQYPVASDVSYATLRGERDTYGTELSKVEVEQNGNSFKGRLNAPIWTSQLFLSDWWRQDKTPINVTVTGGANDQFDFKVENLTGRKIPQARLVFGGRVLELGELPASKTFTVRRQQGQELLNYVNMQSGQFQNAANQRRNQFGGQVFALNDYFTAVSAASFLSLAPQRQQTDQFQPYNSNISTFRDFDLADCAGRGDAVLLAWLPGESLVAPLNRFTPRRSHRDTVLRVIVPSPMSNVQNR